MPKQLRGGTSPLFLESIFYDFRVRNDLGFFSKSQIVVITMDEESDEFLGEQYPYTYASHHRLFSKFLNEKPKIINYLLNPLGPESEMDGKNFIKFKKAIESFKSAGGYFRFGVKMDVWGEQYPPIGLKEFGYSLAVLNKDDLDDIYFNLKRIIKMIFVISSMLTNEISLLFSSANTTSTG